jgi:hypothetical protein
MKQNKIKKQSSNSTSASVRKEMAKPRMSLSARTAERKMDSARIHERPGITVPRTVGKVVP